MQIISVSHKKIHLLGTFFSKDFDFLEDFVYAFMMIEMEDYYN